METLTKEELKKISLGNLILLLYGQLSLKTFDSKLYNEDFILNIIDEINKREIKR